MANTLQQVSRSGEDKGASRHGGRERAEGGAAGMGGCVDLFILWLFVCVVSLCAAAAAAGGGRAVVRGPAWHWRGTDLTELSCPGGRVADLTSRGRVRRARGPAGGLASPPPCSTYRRSWNW
ncbi:hypothetical protein E2C01_017355 [Portunus trituberculatus]|uniref:Uncharacterized protein n=1 Tax=Portunus trituberculatus TaxID=210409 RepID=A0A5B7DSN1_PORTR|nr:hypothetical protein [Portunus trituberculatus]